MRAGASLMHYWDVSSDAGGVAELLMPGRWRLRLAGCREPWRERRCLGCGAGGAPGYPWGCGANSTHALHPQRVGLIQREMLQETVQGVFSSAFWVSVGFGPVAALCYKTCHDVKHCLTSELQQLKICASNPPHLTNSHLLPLLEPSPPWNTLTLHMAN